MFEKDLERRLKSIFGVKRTTYDAPAQDCKEQDCIFIQVLEVKPRMSSNQGGRQIYHVVGYLTMLTQADRMPFGFFFKKLEQANPLDSAAFLFGKETNIPDSPAVLQNLQERRITFTFLYDTQYDPNRGSLTELETTIEIQE